MGILQAQDLWVDLDRIKIPARTVDEKCTMVIGRIRDKYWSAAITNRGEKVIGI
jgi:uncharacterized protein